MDEGLAKFAQPQKELLALIAKKRDVARGAASASDLHGAAAPHWR